MYEYALQIFELYNELETEMSRIAGDLTGPVTAGASNTIGAIQRQDFSIMRARVFLGTALYIPGLLLTDISYTLADPRIRLR